MFTDLPVGKHVDLLLVFAFHLGAACVVSFGFWGPWDFHYAEEKNWAVLGFVLVLAIPVWGLIGYAGAYAAVHLRRRLDSEGGDIMTAFADYIAYEPEVESLLKQTPSLLSGSAVMPDRALERRSQVAPLIDIIKTGNAAMKRGAIFSLGKLERKTAVRILREALHHVDKESQFYVAGQLSKIEREISDSIIRNRRRLELEPDNIELRVQLARHCKDYVESGLLEPSVKRYFLRQAVENADIVLAQDAARVDVALDLADLKRMSGDLVAAVDLYRRVLKLESGSTSARVGLAHCYFSLRDMPNLGTVLRELQSMGSTPPEIENVITFWSGSEETGSVQHA